MIFIDSSELKSTSRLRKLIPHLSKEFGFDVDDGRELINAASVTDLEARTGADVMLSADSFPVTTDHLIKMHLSNGALLVQLKFGNDLSSSFGSRLHEAMYRMWEMGCKQHQRVLLFVGSIGCSRNNILQVNGRQSVPKRQYQAYQTAIRHWNRFGVYYNEPRERMLATTLKNLERGISEPPRLEFWPTRPTHADFDDTFDDISPPKPVKDWRTTVATFPGVGPKRATELMRMMIEAPGREPELITALQWITATKAIRKQMRLPKIKLWGEKTYDGCRRWMFGDDYSVEQGYGLHIDVNYEGGESDD